MFDILGGTELDPRKCRAQSYKNVIAAPYNHFFWRAPAWHFSRRQFAFAQAEVFDELLCSILFGNGVQVKQAQQANES